MAHEEKEYRNESPEAVTADDWSDIGRVARGWVRRFSYFRAESAGNNIYAGPFPSHSYTEAAGSNTDACAADGDAYKHAYTCADANT